MLNLDGAKFDLETREIEYTLPAPFGPKRGPAFLKIIARPASGQNAEFRAAIDRLLSDARKRDFLRNKKLERNDNVDQFIKSGEEAARKTNMDVTDLNFEHCIHSWTTNIQDSGKSLTATRENFLALSEFPHPEIAKLFTQIRDDLTDFAKWQSEADDEIAADEIKNSKRS